MKKIEAYLKPFRLAEVRKVLAEEHFNVVHVLEVDALRPAESYTEVLQGTEYEIDLVRLSLVVLVVEDEDVDRVVERIQSVGSTDHAGDGRILISPVERLIAVDPRDTTQDRVRGEAPSAR